MNPYAVIIILFAIAGLILAIWSWQKINKRKRQLAWPKSEGVIIQSEVSKSLVPKVVYQYKIGEIKYRQEIAFSSEVTAAPELSSNLISNYPLDKTVEVYYNPDSPEVTTLEPGPSREDWVGFIFGASSFVFGLFLLLNLTL